jgi:hypothetical protein
MPSARKIIAKLTMLTGIVLGLAALTLWAHFMWPVVAEDADVVPGHAMRGMMLIFLGGFGLLGLVAWPFAWIAERIDGKSS